MKVTNTEQEYEELMRIRGIMTGTRGAGACACGHGMLADTEEWQQPRCHTHATEDGKTDTWRCNNCTRRPYACLCDTPDWKHLNVGDLLNDRR